MGDKQRIEAVFCEGKSKPTQAAKMIHEKECSKKALLALSC
jgi:hypothetical protein